MTSLADPGSQEKELIREDVGMVSRGKGTWMEYWEQEPLVARIKGHNPQPVAHAGAVKRRCGKQNGSCPWCLLSQVCVSGQRTLPLARRGAL